ncbi:MAG: alpha-rhamnosidase, partial [Clostridiales bacterium]|nr:alpha-rhamnosidase [Clostridiales bacterium]
EFLPLEDKAKFTCDDEAVEKIWDMCSVTFHLNSREFYLDGIKRDRWVWSGDAYQSYMVNRYLYDDPSIIKRTIRALLGKPPYVQHINTINDYSAYMIIGLYEYYFASGDSDFVRAVWSDISSLYCYIASRLDENGYVVWRDGDWIFIDWSDFDKTGAFCAEQILLWQAYRSMSRLCAVVGEEDSYSEKADELHGKIMKDFWLEEKGAFIDSFASGEKHITRHANIFAILYDFVSHEQAQKIAENVLYNDEITHITTPYFKLFELIALCRLGNITVMQDYIDSYWGEMIKLGATTVWEHFDPTQSGDEHLGMYGAEFGKSLCHAWGAGPIYLLGRFVAGVYPTAVGSAEFTVNPNPGKYKSFHSVVPVNDGTVTVNYDGEKLSVCSAASGGTLVFGDKTVKLPVDETVTIAVK